MAQSPAEEAQFKQTQAEILARELDTNEFIPKLSQLTTDAKSVLGAINYLHGQYRTAILNANTAQRVANDAKAVVDAFMAKPPKDGKSAYEIANELRPEGAKYKNEREWIESLDEVKESAVKNAISHMRIFTETTSLTKTISPQNWHHRSDKGGGFTYIIQDSRIKKDCDVDLVSCDVTDKDVFNIMTQITCDNIADGEMTIRIPECDRPGMEVTLDFVLKQYVLKEDNE